MSYCASLYLGFSWGWWLLEQYRHLFQCNSSFLQPICNTGLYYYSFFFFIRKILFLFQDLNLAFTRDASFKKSEISQVFINCWLPSITSMSGDIIFLVCLHLSFKNSIYAALPYRKHSDTDCETGLYLLDPGFEEKLGLFPFW